MKFRRRSGRRFAACTVLALALAWAVPASAQQGAGSSGKRWSNEAELSLVNTSGNSSTTTVAIADRLAYNWRYSEFRFRVAFFRTSTDERFLFNEANGVREERRNRTLTERYEVEGKFRQNLFGQMFWFALGGWYRNRPAGIDNRYVGSGGIGYRLLENARTTLVAEAGVGITKEDQVNGLSDSFVDLRGFVEWRQRVTETTDFEASIELLENLQNTDDARVSAAAAVTARISNRLALRFGWDLKFDNDPPIITVATDPTQPPGPYRLDDTDQTVSASLVVNF